MDADWKSMISPCFGIADKIFALHPLDLKRAYALLGACLDAGVSWQEFEDAVVKWLESKQVKGARLKERFERVEEMMRPWLD